MLKVLHTRQSRNPLFFKSVGEPQRLLNLAAFNVPLLFFIIPFLLELKNGVPVLSVNHGSGTLTLQLSARATVTDRRWHHLDIISDGKV